MENLIIDKEKENEKVVFCEIAWMKYYSGVSEDDQPVNGGKYVKENKEGEKFIILPRTIISVMDMLCIGERNFILSVMIRSYGILMKYRI